MLQLFKNIKSLYFSLNLNAIFGWNQAVIFDFLIKFSENILRNRKLSQLFKLVAKNENLIPIIEHICFKGELLQVGQYLWNAIDIANFADPHFHEG